METELERLVDYLEKVLREREDRILLSIASIPGGGKSTLAFLLAQSLNRRDQRAKVVGLDGWHYSKAQLEQFPVLSSEPSRLRSALIQTRGLGSGRCEIQERGGRYL